MTRTVRIALLLCDTPLPLVQEELGFSTYHPVFESHLQDTLASFPNKEKVEDVELVVDSFDVVKKQEYPADDLLRCGHYDAVMMTGAAYSAYETHPWLIRLIDFIKTLATSAEYDRLKIIGICFGMQVLAMALGGPQAVVPNPEGWEIGVYEVELTEAGKDWFERAQQKGQDRIESSEQVLEHVTETKTIHIQQMHRDHLARIPDNFRLLGSSPRCRVQGIVQYYPESDSSERSDGGKKIRIIGLQGHPEFTPAIVDRMVSVRSRNRVIDRDTTEEAQRRSSAKNGGEGRGVIGWGLWSILLEL